MTTAWRHISTFPLEGRLYLGPFGDLGFVVTVCALAAQEIRTGRAQLHLAISL